LPPTARFFELRKTLPAPSIEPAVVPPVVSPEMSSWPVPFKMNRAVPPLALSAIKLPPPLLVVMVALPAVLVSRKFRFPVLVMLAPPAVPVPLFPDG